jgi:hypothetical protein
MKPLTSDRPAPTAVEFFAEIFRGCSGWLEIRLLAPERGGGARSEFFPLPSGVPEAAAFAAAHSGKEHVFFSVYPRAARGGRDASAVRQVQLLYADLDADHFPDGTGEIDACLAAFSPPPSVVVASGGGRHAYWLLSRPLDAPPGDAHRQVQDVLWAIADALGVPRAKNAVHDLARVLRVPGTLNVKPCYPPPGALCEVLVWEPSRRYPPSAFREFAARGRSRPGRAGGKGEGVRFAGGRVDPEAVLARLRPPPAILKLIHEGAPVGQRSEADQKVITWLLKAGASPDEIRAVFANPRWRIGDKYREPESGDRYLRLSIGNALSWLQQQHSNQGPGGGWDPGMQAWIDELWGLPGHLKRAAKAGKADPAALARALLALRMPPAAVRDALVKHAGVPRRAAWRLVLRLAPGGPEAAKPA